jgi:hypothetical protein
MARPRNTAGDQPEVVEAIDAAADIAVDPTPPLAEVVVPAPAAAKPQAPAAAETPRQVLVPPPRSTAQPAATGAAKPGLRRIGKGEQIRQVHPVDVADWLALGWQVLPADNQSS